MPLETTCAATQLRKKAEMREAQVRAVKDGFLNKVYVMFRTGLPASAEGRVYPATEDLPAYATISNKFLADSWSRLG